MHNLRQKWIDLHQTKTKMIIGSIPFYTSPNTFN